MVLSAIISSAAFKFVYPEVRELLTNTALDAFGETVIFFGVILGLYDFFINTDDDSIGITGFGASAVAALLARGITNEV